MRRRDSILALLAIVAASSPFPVGAQQPVRKLFRIALVPDFWPPWASYLQVLKDTLFESGRIEGRDYVIYRSGVFYGPDTELAINRALEAKPDLIIVANLGYAIELQKRTKTIPIVMWISGFPVEGGVAESLTRPGRNVTGMSIYAGGEVFGKLVDIVVKVKPAVKRIGVFMTYLPPFHPRAESDLIVQGMRDAAGSLGVDLRVFEMAKPEQIDDALAWVVAQGVEALILTGGTSIAPHRETVTRFAIAKRLPTITDSEWGRVEPQPLLRYRARLDFLMRQVVAYAIRILWESAKPGDLPIQLPARFEFVVNLKTAKAIGLTIPQSLLILADTVIE